MLRGPQDDLQRVLVVIHHFVVPGPEKDLGRAVLRKKLHPPTHPSCWKITEACKVRAHPARRGVKTIILSSVSAMHVKMPFA